MKERDKNEEHYQSESALVLDRQSPLPVRRSQLPAHPDQQLLCICVTYLREGQQIR